MFVLSSPSGAGKTTIARRLLGADAGLAMSVSATTRPIRPGEIDGRDYHFVSPARFAAMVREDAFLEWAEVFGQHYGTPRAQIEAGLAKGQDYLFDIDWQGAQQLTLSRPADVVSVFILPPSIAELQRRLAARGTDTPAVVAARMARAREEIRHWRGYHYLVINDDIDACFARISHILAAERSRGIRQTGLEALAGELTRES